jgi:hypothetical protein
MIHSSLNIPTLTEDEHREPHCPSTADLRGHSDSTAALLHIHIIYEEGG